MHAAEVRSVGRLTGREHGVDQVGGTCRGRGIDRGGAVPEVTSAGLLNRFRRAVHEVGAGPAVDVQVDEARSDIGAPGVDDLCAARRLAVGRDRGDPAAVTDHDGSGQEAVGQDRRAVDECKN